MAKVIVPNSKTISLHADSNREFFLIHGYTGSPTDFNGLGKYLHDRFNANVKIIRLIGHGIDIRELDNVQYNDFLNQVEREFVRDLKKGRKIVVGGVSFGGYLASYLASKYPVAGVFNSSTPYKLRFPKFSWSVYYLMPFKKYWTKRGYNKIYKDTGNSFYYDQIHINGIKIIWDSIVHFNTFAKKVVSPFLILHSTKDYLSDIKSVFLIKKKIKSKIKESIFFEGPYHNLFFSEEREKVFKVIGDFFEKQDVFVYNKRKRK